VGRIVAESLVAVSEPVTTVLRWPPPAPVAQVAATIAAHLVPTVSTIPAFRWLRAGQERTAGRIVTVLERHGGALLADPVGTGKTFVSLAAAVAAAGDRRIAAIVPAPLVEQWRARAAECGVELEVVSHSAVSLGRLPAGDPRVVIVDESHHFRHPGTKRYTHLAHFAGGRRILCVTATPIVNRPEEVAHQLLLGVRDDALRVHGIRSLREGLRRRNALEALGELVIVSTDLPPLPARVERDRRWEPDDPAPPRWLEAIDALTLAERGGVGALIRTVLLTAGASSPAALRSALGRYASLLRHADEARRAGIPVDRSALRRLTAESPEQLMLWEVLPVGEVGDQLPLSDLRAVEMIRSEIDLDAPDPKAESLAELLADQRPTLVFTTAVATVPYLCARLPALAPAWVTGARAGWRHVHLPRSAVLGWFRPNAPDVAPHILIASDVAAEGLDLQRAVRVVHYDLPWTAMRVAQREGRSRRYGGRHPEIEVVRMAPAAWAEARLRISAILGRKAALPRRIGLQGGESAWRWRAELAAEWDQGAAAEGVARIKGASPALLVALVAERHGVRVPVVGVVDRSGGWSEDPAAIRKILASVKGATPPTDHQGEWDDWSTAIGSMARAVLGRVASETLAGAHRTPESRAMTDRLRSAMRIAVRRREVERVRDLDRLAAFVARGHTAGEELQIREVYLRSEAALPEIADGLQDAEAVDGPWSVRLVAAIAVTASP
jgi:hypothetical protein